MIKKLKIFFSCLGLMVSFAVSASGSLLKRDDNLTAVLISEHARLVRIQVSGVRDAQHINNAITAVLAVLAHNQGRVGNQVVQITIE